MISCCIGFRAYSDRQCLWKVSTWNSNARLRHVASPKCRQRRPRVCSVRYKQIWLLPSMVRTAWRVLTPSWLIVVQARLKVDKHVPNESNFPNPFSRGSAVHAIQGRCKKQCGTHLLLHEFEGPLCQAELKGLHELASKKIERHCTDITYMCSWVLRGALRQVYFPVAPLKAERMSEGSIIVTISPSLQLRSCHAVKTSRNDPG